VLSADGNVVRVHRGGRSLHFLRNKNPFNDYVAGRLAEDKGYQYELFCRAAVPVPETLQVFNPLADSRFDRYRTHASVAQIVGAAERRFAFPLVVKKCHSSLAQGVYLETNAAALGCRLQELFENSGFLDNIVLLQQFVPGPEYRIVASGDQLLLAYAKVSDAGGERVDLNPLHQADGRAVRVEDAGLLARLRALTAKVAAVLELGFYAIDLIDGPAGACVLEINPNPFCFFYNRTNGREDFVRIYATLLERFLPPV
jgi:glutathione synthase/RimK-type ligase-like ATP-grasp enzyme